MEMRTNKRTKVGIREGVSSMGNRNETEGKRAVKYVKVSAIFSYTYIFVDVNSSHACVSILLHFFFR